MPTRAERPLLGIPPSIGALAIDRLGHADGRPVEWRHVLIRGDRFPLLAGFLSQAGYKLIMSSPQPAAETQAGILSPVF